MPMGMSMSPESHPNPAFKPPGVAVRSDARPRRQSQCKSNGILSIHRLAGVAPDLETVPPNRPFLLGAPAADHYAEALFRTRTGLHAFQFPARHRRSAVMQRIAGLERALEQAQHLLHQDDLTRS
jgi:hypothetical protein